uniref:Protein FAR1-RELATED SEQUENCE n=1 Tax=Chenopodium quinoa TaxID=63459 RepID=A0A803LVU7_CHEQI
MALTDEVLYLSGEEGEFLDDVEFEDDVEMLEYNQQINELHAEGSGDSEGYCTPDEQEEKGNMSMVNMDCVRVDPPEVGMIFESWQEADVYHNAYGKQEGFGVVLAQSAYKMVQGVKNTGLCDFAERYVRAMEYRVDAERLTDGNSVVYIRGLVTDFKIEETTKELGSGLFEHLIKDKVYVFSEFYKKEKPVNKWRFYRVLYNSQTEEVECECKMFECSGILYRHCINALEVQQVSDEPKKYLLDRWRKDIYCKHSRMKVAYHDISKTAEILRYDKMMIAFEPISCLASETDEALKMVIAALKELETKVKQIIKPGLPLSSVGETRTKSTPHSVNKAICVTIADTPSSVGRSVILGDAPNTVEDLPIGGIKDPPTNRGPGYVRSSRFMTTFEEFSEDTVGNYMISMGFDYSEEPMVEDELIQRNEVVITKMEEYEGLLCTTVTYKDYMINRLLSVKRGNFNNIKLHVIVQALPADKRHILCRYTNGVGVKCGNRGHAWDVILLGGDVPFSRPMLFHEGWDTFVTDNAIVAGEILKVYYTGGGLFYARIYSAENVERLPSAAAP